MTEKIIVIGKVDDASGQRILIQYEAQTGGQHQWVPRKAITRQEALTDGRSVFSLETIQTEAGTYNPHKQFMGNSAPLVTDEKDIMIVSAFENNEDIPELSLDDSKPSFHKFDTPNIIKLEDANGDPIPQDIWGGALITGGRFETICDWDFEPVLLPAYVPVQEGDNNPLKIQTAPRMQRVNNTKGDSAVYLGFNTNFKSAREPAGALLGTYSDRYYPLSYPTLCRPILQRAALNGWQASVLAFDRGKQMRLDCDVSGAVHFKRGYGTDVISDKWTTVAEADSGWLAPETMMGLQEQVHSMWRYGFSIHNSLDGSGSLKLQAVARRNACTNAGVIGGQRTIAAMRHTRGVMEPVNWDDFAGTIDSVIVDAQRGLGHVEALKHVRLEDAQFERLITLSERAGLISYPRPNKDGNLIGSHMWELFGHGWTNYNEPWVAVQPENKGTLFHAYQVMTGAVTHKPEWTDGRRKLTGNTLKMNTFNKRLQKIDSLLTTIGTNTMKDYARENGEAITDWGDFKSYVKDAGITGLGEDVPTVSEVLKVLNE